jgi:hypothetical protein
MITSGILLLFLLSVWLVRWHNIARPHRELLNAAVETERARFRSETGIDLLTSPDVAYLKDLLDSAAIEWASWFDFFFWTRGQEMTGWGRLHEFQRASVKLLASDTVRARLESLGIKDVPEDALRAQLVEALTSRNDQLERSFAQLVGWQSKAFWLAGLGCGLVAMLAAVVGNPVLFIAGAAGGYLSRLSRALQRADVPTDYGASWTTLFLSPIVGALSGWFGILMIVAVGDSRFQIRWEGPVAPVTLGVAFALGFSERFFDSVMSGVEEKQ